ncbi:hypothetical protein PFISCL1PPCAC_4406, partial [Pristionchus fissidentatus]
MVKNSTNDSCTFTHYVTADPFLEVYASLLQHMRPPTATPVPSVPPSTFPRRVVVDQHGLPEADVIEQEKREKEHQDNPDSSLPQSGMGGGDQPGSSQMNTMRSDSSRKRRLSEGVLST